MFVLDEIISEKTDSQRYIEQNEKKAKSLFELLAQPRFELAVLFLSPVPRRRHRGKALAFLIVQMHGEDVQLCSDSILRASHVGHILPRSPPMAGGTRRAVGARQSRTLFWFGK